MAATDVLSRTARPKRDSVAAVRAAIIVVTLLAWEAMAASGLLYRDVVPSLVRIAAAFAKLIASPAFYSNLSVSAWEVGVALTIGGGLGLAVGLLLGGNRFVGAAFERYLYYLGPTPKIVFFPIMIMWFGVGPGSKIAMGAISCFFPVALSTAAGMRQIDPVLIRVGRSFGASALQMVAKVYLPAMRAPVLNGLRLGFGIAIIGVLLAETKLSKEGLGFMINQAYSLFDMPMMYAILIVVFAIAILCNAALGRLVDGRRASRS
jgi:ABC-type nitrate/sulfonate/bicarbonate transport system permease component